MPTLQSLKLRSFLLVAAIVAPTIAEAQLGSSRRVDRVLAKVSTVEQALPLATPSLDDPIVLRAIRGGLLLIDAATPNVKALRTSGALRWQSGRLGSGPGEFQQPTSLAGLPDGRVAIADGPLGRVTLLAEDGRIDTVFSVGRPVHRAFPFRGDTLLLTALGDSLFVKYVAGRRIAALPLPASLRFLDTTAIQRDYKFAQTASGDVVAVFSYSGLIAKFSHQLGTMQFAQGPSALPWPVDQVREVRMPNGRLALERRLADGTRLAAQAIAADADFVYVLSRPPAKGGQQYIDLFDAMPLRYRCSMPVAGFASQIAALDGTIFLLRADPEPRLSRVVSSMAARSSTRDSPCEGG